MQATQKEGSQVKRRGAPPGNQNAKKTQARVAVSLSLSKERQRFVEAQVRAQGKPVTQTQCRAYVRHLAYAALDQAMRVQGGTTP